VLDLCLSAEELEGESGSYMLVLSAAHPFDEVIVLHPSMARLSETVTTVDPQGSEQRSVNSRALEHLSHIEIPPGEPTRVELAELDLPAVAGILAIRARVRLALLPGGLSRGERALPAQDLRVEPVECVRLAAVLPAAAIEPRELLRYVTEERVRRPALMERAVRILPARRGEALDLLAANVNRLSVPACEDLVPALRWLDEERTPGGDPTAWREWLLARAGRRADELDDAAPLLDLPVPRER
jgi:hypothetical protein